MKVYGNLAKRIEAAYRESPSENVDALDIRDRANGYSGGHGGDDPLWPEYYSRARIDWLTELLTAEMPK